MYNVKYSLPPCKITPTRSKKSTTYISILNQSRKASEPAYCRSLQLLNVKYRWRLKVTWQIRSTVCGACQCYFKQIEFVQMIIGADVLVHLSGLLISIKDIFNLIFLYTWYYFPNHKFCLVRIHGPCKSFNFFSSIFTALDLSLMSLGITKHLSSHHC